MENKERLYWNVVKGMAVFLMLWGHCIQFCALDVVDYFGNAVFKTIYAFHMPLFMLVSGYLFYSSFCKRELKPLLVHRIQGMLHPIVFCTIVNNLLMMVPQRILSGKTQLFFGAVFRGLEYSFWFLWAVLIASVAVAVACKITHNKGLQLLLTVLGGVFVALFPQWEMSLAMYPYFVVGFFCAMYRGVLSGMYHKLKYVSIVIFPLMLAFFETEHYIYITPVYSPVLGLTESLKIDVFRWGIGFAGSVCLMTLLDLVFRLWKVEKETPRLIKALSRMGENSLQIYCLSEPLLSGYLPHVYRKLMDPFGGNLFAENMTVYNFVLTPVLAVAYAVLLYSLVLLLRRVKLHSLIFGR